MNIMDKRAPVAMPCIGHTEYGSRSWWTSTPWYLRTVSSKTLEHRCRMLYAGCSCFIGLALGDGHAPNLLSSTIINSVVPKCFLGFLVVQDGGLVRKKFG